MRYTTLIDISEYPQLYRSSSVRLVYLHLVLKSGFHDDDRDLCAVSIRRLANDCGLTVAATRHALGLLEKAAMITRQGPLASDHCSLLKQAERVPGGGNSQATVICKSTDGNCAQISIIVVKAALEYQVQVDQANAGTTIQLRILGDIY